MKKIINGKKYDTNTATEVGCCSYGISYRDFSWMEETLYRKKNGEFFLHGEGGPMTKYAELDGDNARRSGERIIPMTEDEAKAWAEDSMNTDEYEALFGEVEE